MCRNSAIEIMAIREMLVVTRIMWEAMVKANRKRSKTTIEVGPAASSTASGNNYSEK
jgi:hypothetical protein